ncbi:hypothetical protein [Sphingomonas humi]
MSRTSLHRQLLLADDCSATSAAFAVGYLSASQFSLERQHQFGAPPATDVRRNHQAIAA